jgi:hypothetical protein
MVPDSASVLIVKQDTNHTGWEYAPKLNILYDPRTSIGSIWP